ncbi:MAG: D-alanine--poly(phosphoribitol) ligase subunit DltC [Eubacteriaceae bacterium]|nr:D-alanine--poly(phosphoribitol) ligase subunit DltC [Eubacteriaceae bacterium]
MEEKILDLLAEICDDEIVKEDRNINMSEEGLLDSLGYTELLVGLEELFDITLSPSAVSREEVETPEKVIALVREMKGQ